jgi:sulfide:quinone oxidoreductase
MANILILGGGFGGVAMAETLSKKLAREHQITLVSRSRRFIFYPALVRLAFGEYEIDDISYDLREAMLNRGIRFVQGEVARVNPYKRRVTIAHGEVEGDIPYDYLIFALGGRLASERVTGYFEHAHHSLTVEAALKFGDAVRSFREGRVVVGNCPESRLAIPVYETACALSHLLEDRVERGRAQITVVSPARPGDEPGGSEMGRALGDALYAHSIEFLPDFPIDRITAKSVLTSRGGRLVMNC